MNIKAHLMLFDLIAPFYALFFNYQVYQFRKQLQKRPELNSGKSLNILDLGSGTGALAFALANQGHRVIGLDGSRRMVRIANRLNKHQRAVFYQANLIAPALALTDLLPPQTRWPEQGENAQPAPDLVQDNPPDLVITSFVLHGLTAPLRKAIFDKIRACTCRQLLVMDYSQHRSWPVDLIEWAEGGDYFNFVRTFESELTQAFGEFTVESIHRHVNWYSIHIVDQTSAR